LRAILTWHSIDESGSVISTRRDAFERQLDSLVRRNVRVVPLASLPLLDDKEDAAALTFDDGFLNFAADAVPLLKARAFTATVFVVADRVGTTNAWDDIRSGLGIPSLPLLTWEQIRRVKEDGFDVGGHGLTHRSLPSLDRDEQVHEVRGCADAVEEHCGVRPTSFAFPYGAHDTQSVDVVSQFFPVACTTEMGTVTERSSVHELPRLDMFYFREGTVLESWGSVSFRAFVALRSAARTIRSHVQP
jgi:peptidoglycan/xylan/chitin deacetylase (PgdA/CDA1 family)